MEVKVIVLFDRKRGDREVRGSFSFKGVEKASELILETALLTNEKSIVNSNNLVAGRALIGDGLKGVGNVDVVFHSIVDRRQQEKTDEILTDSKNDKKSVVAGAVKTFSSTKTTRWLAAMCLLISFLGFSNFALPIVLAEFSQRSEGSDQAKSSLAEDLAPPSELPVFLAVNKDNKDDINKYKDFRIFIPKLKLEAPIVKNVDPNNESEYKEQLKNGVAHALGSYLPGEGGQVFLFAHSTDSIWNISRLNALFYGVKDLKVDDVIEIKYGESIYKYRIAKREVVSPKDIESLRSEKFDLILSTCYPPGTDWQRLVVFANQVGKLAI